MSTPSAVTVGNFDGVHTGHRLLFRELRRLAAERGLSSMAFTFREHPLALVAPERCPVPLQSVSAKEQSIRTCGVEPVIVPFNDGLRRMSAEEFMAMLSDRYSARLLLVGHDNRFGFHSHDKAVSQQQAMDRYRLIGERLGMEVVEGPVLPGVSSSEIRRSLSAGQPEKAAVMLGHPWQWTGAVVAGRQLGRTIGFPTANLVGDDPPPVIAPGVYAATATLPDGSVYPAMVNVGRRPTVSPASPCSAPPDAVCSGTDLTVEAHLIGFDGDLYGVRLTLAFVRRLRSECRFPSLEALRSALATDRLAALAALTQGAETY